MSRRNVFNHKEIFPGNEGTRAINRGYDILAIEKAKHSDVKSMVGSVHVEYFAGKVLLTVSLIDTSKRDWFAFVVKGIIIGLAAYAVTRIFY